MEWRRPDKHLEAILSIMAPEEPGLDIAGPTHLNLSHCIFSGSASPDFPMAKFCVSNRDRQD